MKRILILFLLISSSSLHAYQLRLYFSRAYVYNDILYADVYTEFNEEIYNNIKRYIDNGIIVFINFRVDLVNKTWFIDNNIREIYLYRKIYYDFFTKEYVVLNSETMMETRNTNFNVLMKNFSVISRIEVINVNKLNIKDKFFFKTRLSIQFQNAYPYLSVFFNIITPIQYRIKWLKTKEFYIKELYYNNM